MSDKIVREIHFESTSEAEDFLAKICNIDPSLIVEMNEKSGSFDIFAMFPKFECNRVNVPIDIGFSEKIIDRVNLAISSLPPEMQR